MAMNGETQKGISQNGHKKSDFSLISIIIPMYNVETYVCNCITSIMRQTYKNFEIIMINDGSVDGTESVCLGLTKKYSQIRYFQQENSGAGAARNKGMKLSKGNYLAFVDADDYLHPTYLEELYFLITNFDVKMACCSYIKGLEKDIDIFLKNVQTGNSIKFNREEALSSLFYRKEIAGYPYVKIIDANLAREVQFPINLKIGEDFTFVYQILKRTDQVAYTSKQLYFYMQNQEGITHNLTVMDMKLLWHQIACNMLNEMQKESKIIVRAIKAKLFILAYDFLVKLKDNTEEVEFKHKLVSYIRRNRKSIMRDVHCKKSNRLLGMVCCININLAIKAGYFFTKMEWNLKKAL